MQPTLGKLLDQISTLGKHLDQIIRDPQVFQSTQSHSLPFYSITLVRFLFIRSAMGDRGTSVLASPVVRAKSSLPSTSIKIHMLTTLIFIHRKQRPLWRLPSWDTSVVNHQGVCDHNYLLLRRIKVGGVLRSREVPLKQFFLGKLSFIGMVWLERAGYRRRCWLGLCAECGGCCVCFARSFLFIAIAVGSLSRLPFGIPIVSPQTLIMGVFHTSRCRVSDRYLYFLPFFLLPASGLLGSLA